MNMSSVQNTAYPQTDYQRPPGNGWSATPWARPPSAPNTSTKIRHEGPTLHGRACTTCARAKTKCLWSSSNTVCERCLRLSKPCQPVLAARKRRTKQSSSKTARLEEKLDGLVSLLQSATQAGPSPDAGDSDSSSPASKQAIPTPESLPAGVSSPRSSQQDQLLCSMLAEQRRKEHFATFCVSGPRHAPVISPDTSYAVTGTRSSALQAPQSATVSLEPTLQIADTFLATFKDHFHPQFPFLEIPESSTALRQERPFLWLCILAITSPSTAQQKALGMELRITLGRELLIEGKNNLDLLLGLLVYNAWGQYHLFDRPILTPLMQCAIGLSALLSINKPPVKDPPHMMLDFDAAGCPKKFIPSTRSMEERRAMLTVYLISSEYATYFQRTDALQWTPYLQECTQILIEKQEYHGDTFLAFYARLRVLIGKVTHIPGYLTSVDTDGSVRAPPALHIKSLQSQLREFKQSLPSDLLRDDTLTLQLFAAEVTMHEVALNKSIPLSDFQRIDWLYAALQAIKSWFDLFFTLSPERCRGMPISEMTQMSHCIIALFRLSTFDFAEWDRGLVRSSCNLSLILGQLIQQFTGIKNAVGLDPETPDAKDMYSYTAKTIVTIKEWWDAKVEAESARLDPTVTDDIMADLPALDFSNDAWLTDLLSFGDYPFVNNNNLQ